MDKKDIAGELKRTSELLRSVRELLLTTAHQSVTGNGGGDWQTAETLFRFAKEADILGLKILELVKEESGIQSSRLADAGSQEIKDSKPSTTKKRRKLKKSEYPKFVVRGDSLFKIGLKRDGTSEYSHSVPSPVFLNVVKQLLEISASQIEFVADDILSMVDAPDYQVYIVLALFRENDILEIPRRGFHKFVSADKFEQSAFNLWDVLKHSQKV